MRLCNSVCERALSLLDPFERIAMTHPTKWLVFLSCLGFGWLVATFLTALGMYMVACTESNGVLIDGNPVYHYSNCHGPWTLNDAHLILIVGSLLNVCLLVVMVVLLIKERRTKTARADPPPDYETLIKSETPPPNYDELNLQGQRDVESPENTTAQEPPLYSELDYNNHYAEVSWITIPIEETVDEAGATSDRTESPTSSLDEPPSYDSLDVCLLASSAPYRPSLSLPPFTVSVHRTPLRSSSLKANGKCKVNGNPDVTI